MAEQEIKIPLAIDPSFWEETDRRFDQMARRAAQQFSQAMRAQGGLGGGGGSAPGGGAFGGGGTGGAGGAAGQIASTLIAGAGQGFLNTPAASASSPSVLAQNATVGAAQAGVGLLKTGLQVAGGAVGGVLGGPGGALVGAAAGGTIGDLVQSQFNSVKEAMEIPTERGVARLKGVYGNFAASGVETSREEREQAISFAQEVERRRYSGERMIEKEYREIAARDSISYGLSWIGR